MERFILFDNKNSWYDYHLILTKKEITPPEPKTKYIEIDGKSGSLDLSESLTGEITYKDRTISVSFWTNYGKRADRVKLLTEFTKAVHGRKLKIIEPDNPEHYFYGRVKIKSTENIIPYATVDIEATVEPWRYAQYETSRSIDVNGSVDLVLNNNGTKTLCPDVHVTGNITIKQNDTEVSLTDGSFKVSDIKLSSGSNVLTITGNGSVKFVYREADL